jgi:hypothetical protein
LKTGIFSLEEISRRVGFSSGGGLKFYLKNLEQAEIIRSFIPFGKGFKSKFKKYALFDEFLYFYFSCIGIFIFLRQAAAPYSRSWDSLGFGASFQT